MNLETLNQLARQFPTLPLYYLELLLGAGPSVKAILGVIKMHKIYTYDERGMHMFWGIEEADTFYAIVYSSRGYND
jgi:hypothetical protein